MVSGHWHLTSSLRRLTSFQLHSKMTSAHFKTFVATTFWSLLLFVEGQGREGRLVHGKYFGPLNETSPFSKDIRHDEIETGWFSQPLDHFNRNDRRKWNQVSIQLIELTVASVFCITNCRNLQETPHFFVEEDQLASQYPVKVQWTQDG